MQHLGQLAQWLLVIHQMSGVDFAFREVPKRSANVGRRVVEGGLTGDLSIVKQRSVEPDLSACRTAAEKVDGATFADKQRG